MGIRHVGLIAAAVVLCASAAQAQIRMQAYTSDDTLLRIGPFSFEGGRTLNLTVGIGSAAFRHPTDPPNVIWTVGDRGPNIACSDVRETIGTEMAVCREVSNGRIYPTPSYTPSIYRVMLLPDHTFRITDVITLKDREGRPLNGMLNPLRTATTEIPFDGRGNRLQQDVHGIDCEGLVRLADGTFWISD